MLVLLSFALVLLATVLLVLGLLNDDGLTLIYVSIASSVAAALVLVIALRVSKPKAEKATAPRPIPEPEPVGSGASASAGAWDEPADDGWSDEGEVDFPIADYDDLTVAQILPLLPQLYADEIGVVEARERATKARPSILDKLAQLRGDVTERGFIVANHTREDVIDDDRRNGRDQADCGRQQRFGNPWRNHRQVGGLRLRNADKAVHDAPDRTEQTDER